MEVKLTEGVLAVWPRLEALQQVPAHVTQVGQLELSLLRATLTARQQDRQAVIVAGDHVVDGMVAVAVDGQVGIGLARQQHDGEEEDH